MDLGIKLLIIWFFTVIALYIPIFIEDLRLKRQRKEIIKKYGIDPDKVSLAVLFLSRYRKEG